MNKLTDKIDNRYILVNVAAQRAREIAQESEDRGIILEEKIVTLALMEIAEGKVELVTLPGRGEE